MHKLLVIVFIFLGSALQAQVVPGYQGKKTIVSYQANISPALRRPTFNNKVYSGAASSYLQSEESAFIPFNVTHNLIFERVMGRKFSFSLNYTFVATKDYITLSQRVSDKASNTSRLITFDNVQQNIFGHYIGGSLIFYGKRALAPFGKYFKLNFSYCQMVSSFTRPTLTSEPENTGLPSTVFTFDTKKVHYGQNSVGFGCSFGMNRIYFDRLVVNRGVSFFYLLKPDYVSTPANNAKEVIYWRLRGHDIVSFYLSVGYLF